jgi:hypothetical protein
MNQSHQLSTLFPTALVFFFQRGDHALDVARRRACNDYLSTAKIRNNPRAVCIFKSPGVD